MRLSAFLLTLCVFLYTVPSDAGDAPNLFGLKLGMTPAEAEKTLKENRPDLKVQKTMTGHTYSGGTTEHKTPEFISTVTGTKSKPPVDNLGKDEENVVLSFTQTPENPQLVVIARTQTAIAKPVSLETYKQRLTERYGKPSADDKSVAGKQFLFWSTNDGKINCLKNIENYSTLATNKNIGESLFAIPEGTDQKDCQSGVIYQLTGDPVTATNAAIFDITKILEADQKTKDRLAGLETDARKKSATEPETPAAPTETETAPAP